MSANGTEYPSQSIPDQDVQAEIMEEEGLQDVETYRPSSVGSIVAGGSRVNTYAAKNWRKPQHFVLEQPPPIPHWQRELAASRVGRHSRSRASSIVSCRTKLTVSTDDARSVEFEAGGRSFRISRDGSNVSDVTAPPPYPGPPLEELREESDEEDVALPSARPSSDTVRQRFLDDGEFVGPSSELRSVPIRTHLPAQMVGDEGSPAVTRRAGVLELPQRLRSALSSWYTAASPNPEASNATSTWVHVLRRTQSDSSNLANFRVFSPDAELDEQGHHTTALVEAGRQGQNYQLGLSQTDASGERAAESSRNYAKLMRDLDRQHRQKLHERDEELSRLRLLLDEKDKVLRQQLREREFVNETLSMELASKNKLVNDLKTRVYEMEEESENKIERARHEIEDIWEKRWKDYERLLMEKLGEAHQTMRAMKPPGDSAVLVDDD